jgi:hypothetical protein
VKSGEILIRKNPEDKSIEVIKLGVHCEVLCHHLDELLRQGIIAPVSENEDVPITSPIVLV